MARPTGLAPVTYGLEIGILTWHGWPTSLEDVFRASSILYGGNLRQRPKDDEHKETHVPKQTDQPVSHEHKETHVPKQTDQPVSPSQKSEANE